MLFLKPLDNTLPSRYRDTYMRYSDTYMGYRSVIEIQRYRYGIQISYWDTEIQWYRYEIQTVEIQMRYRSLGPVWVHTKALGRVLRRFCPLGTRLCMHRYDEIWDSISLFIRVALGRDVTQIVRHCPSVEVRIWLDYFPRYLFDDSFRIQYLIW